MFRRHWGLILVCVQVLEHGPSTSGRLSDEQSPHAQASRRAQHGLAILHRLLSKAPQRRLPRRGGAWKEGDFSFRGVLEKNSKEDVADKFGLGYLRNSASSR